MPFKNTLWRESTPSHDRVNVVLYTCTLENGAELWNGAGCMLRIDFLVEEKKKILHFIFNLLRASWFLQYSTQPHSEGTPPLYKNPDYEVKASKKNAEPPTPPYGKTRIEHITPNFLSKYLFFCFRTICIFLSFIEKKPIADRSVTFRFLRLPQRKIHKKIFVVVVPHRGLGEGINPEPQRKKYVFLSKEKMDETNMNH